MKGFMAGVLGAIVVMVIFKAIPRLDITQYVPKVF